MNLLNVDVWTCRMCQEDFPITIEPNRVYTNDTEIPINFFCDSCDKRPDEGI